ncbi:MAG: PEGA domain-containing protein, partial [Gammaproteobacteria bacterium]|nr:PEGA domain-containing protein [Gammaproteobacteria bacterium]
MADWVLATEQSGYTRHFDAEALPVSIGGDDGNDIVLADVRGGIQIGLLDEVFFVQPGRDSSNVRLDGEPLRGSKKLQDGAIISIDTARLNCRLHDGRLSLEIEAQITAGDTAPPDFDALAKRQADAVTIDPIKFDPKSQGASTTTRKRISKAQIAVAAAFAVLATLGWFAFTAKSVEFELTPAPDLVELPDTWFKFNLGNRYLLRPGEHRLVAELEGYYPIDQTFRVGQLTDQTVAIEFVRLPGLISFSTTPATEAEIKVDGEVIGQAPLTDFEVRPGTHQVQFTAERYLTEVVSVDVEGG